MNSAPAFLKFSTAIFILAAIAFQVTKPIIQLAEYGIYFLMFAGLLWFVSFSFTVADIAENLQKDKSPFRK